MNFCVKCKHASYMNGVGEVVCNNLKYINEVDLVSGRVPKTTAREARYDESKCGKSGRSFEPIRYLRG